ncbi:hypothetical protein B296_00009061 [Ensete ventricosum]|uniref:Uncharacterized protein n=1 Tax=Ensete ventricosum TaxID=4639 RepID=A0A427AQM6_ENSVE|nr:hypothetical protein B296_00009061 [Ensete ventricosum]
MVLFALLQSSYSHSTRTSGSQTPEVAVERKDPNRAVSGRCHNPCSLPMPVERDSCGNHQAKLETAVSAEHMKRPILLTANGRSWRSSDDEMVVDLTEPRLESFMQAYIGLGNKLPTPPRFPEPLALRTYVDDLAHLRLDQAVSTLGNGINNPLNEHSSEEALHHLTMPLAKGAISPSSHKWMGPPLPRLRSTTGACSMIPSSPLQELTRDNCWSPSRPFSTSPTRCRHSSG